MELSRHTTVSAITSQRDKIEARQQKKKEKKEYKVEIGSDLQIHIHFLESSGHVKDKSKLKLTVTLMYFTTFPPPPLNRITISYI